MKLDKRNNELDYKDEHKHERWVKNANFIHSIESPHPLSVKYKPFWAEIKRRCMEGFWAEGKWMPGPLYFYINLCKIRVDKKGGSTTKVIGRPWLRDLEWEKAYVLMEARGFSGFELDEYYTCYEPFENYEKLHPDEQADILNEAPRATTVFDREGNRVPKKFMRARDYLRKQHLANLGKPQFHNSAYNVIDIECRGGGKSYWGANGIVLHPYLMDGVYDYDDFKAQRNAGEPYSVDVLVGAIDGKYTKDLLEKVALSMDTMVGEFESQGTTYPSPLLKRHEGSWYSGKQFIINEYKVKKGNEWLKKGSKSKIYHRTFKDDEHAGNGIRISIGVLEEVGFMYNLKESLGHMKDTMYNSLGKKFGTLYMFGTGGDMEGGSSEAARDVFFDPAAYDCLTFENVWQDNGMDVGFFVPYHMGISQFKDEEGRTDIPKAKKFVEKKRDKLKKAKNKQPLYHEQQNNPEDPAEAFSVPDGNLFPVGELREHQGWLRSAMQSDGFVNGQLGTLVWEQGEDDKPVVAWRPDIEGKLQACGFPVKQKDDKTGAVQIWEHPQTIDGQIPFGMYIAGTDPYDQDQADNSASLGSTFVYKTFHTSDGIYEWPVAEYTARPGSAAEHHENVRKLLTYYNARDLYENERNTLKMHFEHKNSLYLLSRTPTILKATEGTKVQRQYGIHMTKQIKQELEIYTRDWLLQERGDGKLNLHMIYSMPLLEELIRYNETGNFDRVISFMLVILHRLNNHKIKVEAVKEEVKAQDPFLARAFGGKFYG